MKKFVILFFAAFLLAQAYDAAADPSVATMQASLKKATSRLNAWLGAIDEDLATSSQLLSKVDFTGDGAREILRGLCIGRPYVIDCSIVDRSGVIINIVPAEYNAYKGTDISKQDHIIAVHKTHKPVLGGEFLSIEGIFTIIFEYPIFNSDREFIGSFGMLVEPEKFLGNIIGPLVRESPVRIWVMEEDGDVIYTEHPEFVGKNIFRDEIFKTLPGMIAFAKEAAAKRTGEGSYDFYEHYDEDRKTITAHQAVWGTVEFYGTAWRVIVAE